MIIHRPPHRLTRARRQPLAEFVARRSRLRARLRVKRTLRRALRQQRPDHHFIRIQNLNDQRRADLTIFKIRHIRSLRRPVWKNDQRPLRRCHRARFRQSQQLLLAQRDHPRRELRRLPLRHRHRHRDTRRVPIHKRRDRLHHRAPALDNFLPRNRHHLPARTAQPQHRAPLTAQQIARIIRRQPANLQRVQRARNIRRILQQMLQPLTLHHQISHLPRLQIRLHMRRQLREERRKLRIIIPRHIRLKPHLQNTENLVLQQQRHMHKRIRRPVRRRRILRRLRLPATHLRKLRLQRPRHLRRLLPDPRLRR